MYWIRAFKTVKTLYQLTLREIEKDISTTDGRAAKNVPSDDSFNYTTVSGLCYK